MFFIVVYSHISRGLYYGSYMKPRELLWCSRVILFVLTVTTTVFTGYVLLWGPMSFWGATLNRFFSIYLIVSFLIVLPYLNISRLIFPRLSTVSFWLLPLAFFFSMESLFFGF